MLAQKSISWSDALNAGRDPLAVDEWKQAKTINEHLDAIRTAESDIGGDRKSILNKHIEGGNTLIELEKFYIKIQLLY